MTLFFCRIIIRSHRLRASCTDVCVFSGTDACSELKCTPSIDTQPIRHLPHGCCWSFTWSNVNLLAHLTCMQRVHWRSKRKRMSHGSSSWWNSKQTVNFVSAARINVCTVASLPRHWSSCRSSGRSVLSLSQGDRQCPTFESGGDLGRCDSAPSWFHLQW